MQRRLSRALIGALGLMIGVTTVIPIAASGTADADTSGQGCLPLNTTNASRPVSDLVEISTSTDPSGTTVEFGLATAPRVQTAVGVPGVREICVYPNNGTMPISSTVHVSGADGTPWVDPPTPTSFSFTKDGTQAESANLPLDGATYDLATVVWAANWPGTRLVLVHLSDAAECARIGATSNTCWVRPGNVPDGPPLAKPPVIADDDLGTYDLTYPWSVGKTADPSHVDQAVGSVAEIAYSVTYTRGEAVLTNARVTGELSVQNLNDSPFTVDTISDRLSNGIDCSIDTSAGLVIPPGLTVFGFSCDMGDAAPPAGLNHLSSVTWSEQTLADGSLLPGGSATVTSPPLPFLATELDGCADVSDSNAGTPVTGRICDTTTFDYTRQITVEPGCESYLNTAAFATADTAAEGSADVTSEVCGPQDLRVSTTALAAFTRTYGWGIGKSAEPPVQTTPGSGSVSWTIAVAKDAGTDSDFTAQGTITVQNPNRNDVSNVTLTAATEGGTCTVDDGSAVAVATGSQLSRDYSCSFATKPAGGSVTATATWDKATYGTANDNASGSAEFAFGDPTLLVNDSIDVVDSNGGSWTFDDDATVNYLSTYDDPAGTCTEHSNTATITQTGQAATADAEVCVGADVTVSKTASTSFTRSYGWDIDKSVNPTLVKKFGGSATVGYEVDATQTSAVDSNWTVHGVITISNPNDWQDIQVGLADSLEGCTLDADRITVAAASSTDIGYECPRGSAEAGTNTATATWDNSAAATPSASASATADFRFDQPTSRTNQTVTVTDTTQGALGTLSASDTVPYAHAEFQYSRTVAVPTADCQIYDNTARILETGQTADAAVTVCGPATTGALTIGYWQNRNGQSLISSGASTSDVCNTTIWLRQFAPFQDLGAASRCSAVASYAFNVVKAANASGSSMNAMLKAQMLATALDVYFSDPSLGGNRILAPAPIGGATVDLTLVCVNIGSGCTTTENTSAAFGGNSSMTVLGLLRYAATRSNTGGSTWYSNLKAVQALAKDTFDAINNSKVFR